MRHPSLLQLLLPDPHGRLSLLQLLSLTHITVNPVTNDILQPSLLLLGTSSMANKSLKGWEVFNRVPQYNTPVSSCGHLTAFCSRPMPFCPGEK